MLLKQISLQRNISLYYWIRYGYFIENNKINSVARFYYLTFPFLFFPIKFTLTTPVSFLPQGNRILYFHLHAFRSTFTNSTSELFKANDSWPEHVS